ncbi:HalOD1 output domain-containing protein [Natronorubrum sp. FCH18a]|uniref:HalOD1 output domain-containing protein n=1 Tax=Natronorubrum sp. FCH18a TaxID=3447018 RepID=UPI003F514D24
MPEMSAQNNTIGVSENSLSSITSEWNQDSENTPVFAVVSAVAEVEGADPVELPPLYEAIDPEALNDLLTSRPEPVTVSFQYAGYDVDVRGSGKVVVQASYES